MLLNHILECNIPYSCHLQMALVVLLCIATAAHVLFPMDYYGMLSLKVDFNSTIAFILCVMTLKCKRDAKSL